MVEQQIDLDVFGIGGKSGFDHGEAGFDFIDDVEGGGVAGFEDGQEDAAFVADVDDAVLDGEAITDVGDILDVDDGAVDGFDGQVVEEADAVGAAVVIVLVFLGADLGGAAGEDEVLGVDGVGDVVGRNAIGGEFGGVEVDDDLALLSAVGVGHFNAGDGDEGLADKVEGGVEEFLLGDGFAADGELEDRDVGGVVLNDERRLGAGGHDADGGLGDGGDLGDGDFDLGVFLEVDFDDADAVEGLAFGVLDIVDGGGEDAFVGPNDTFFHIARRHAGVVEDDRDDGDVDFGKDVGGDAEEDHVEGRGRRRAWRRRRKCKGGVRASRTIHMHLTPQRRFTVGKSRGSMAVGQGVRW